jgi:hypothetical protein
MARKQCAFCGTFVGEDVKRCPSCREEIPERVEIHKAPQGGPEIRRGLLCMLLGAAAYYFAKPGGPIPLPFHVPGVVTTYLLPLLFILGVCFAIFGGFRRMGLF